MTGVRLVDKAILRRFDRALSAYAPAVRAHLLNPGLEADDIQQRFAAVGVRPSGEALAWWGYFDAAAVDPSELEVLPVFRFTTVDQSVDLYRWQRTRAEEAAADAGPTYTADDAWGPQWVPLFGFSDRGDVVLDCADGLDAPSPLRQVFPDAIFASDYASVLAPSLGEMLIGATQWVEQGRTRWDPDRRQWWPLEPWWMKDFAELYAGRN